jgi:hypothetical protein
LSESGVGVIEVVIVIVEDGFLKDVDVLLEIYELIFLLFHCGDGFLLNLRLNFYLMFLFMDGRLFFRLLFLYNYHLLLHFGLKFLLI